MLIVSVYLIYMSYDLHHETKKRRLYKVKAINLEIKTHASLLKNDRKSVTPATSRFEFCRK